MRTVRFSISRFTSFSFSLKRATVSSGGRTLSWSKVNVLKASLSSTIIFLFFILFTFNSGFRLTNMDQFDMNTAACGDVAQMGERGVRNAEVRFFCASCSIKPRFHLLHKLTQTLTQSCCNRSRLSHESCL